MVPDEILAYRLFQEIKLNLLDMDVLISVLPLLQFNNIWIVKLTFRWKFRTLEQSYLHLPDQLSKNGLQTSNCILSSFSVKNREDLTMDV